MNYINVNSNVSAHVIVTKCMVRVKIVTKKTKKHLMLVSTKNCVSNIYDCFKGYYKDQEHTEKKSNQKQYVTTYA